MIKASYTKHKELIHKLIWRSLQVLTKQGVTFAIFFLTARLLLPFEFGIYNYLLTIVGLLVIVSDFGLSTAASKYVAEFSVTDRNKISGVPFNSALVLLVLSLLLALGAIAIGPSFTPDNYRNLLLILPLIFLIPMTSVYDGIYRGLDKFRRLSLISTVAGAVGLGLAFVATQQFGLTGALIAQDILYIVLLLLLVLGHRETSFKLDYKLIGQVSKYSLIIGIANVSHFFYNRIDILFLGQYGYITEISYYEILNKLLGLVMLPFNVIGQVIAPQITRDYAQGKFTLLLSKYKLFLKVSTITSILVIAGLYLTFPLILRLLGPYDIPPVHQIVMLVLPVFFFNMVDGVLPFMSTAMGYAKLNTYSLIAFGLVNTIADFILINSMGYIGISYASIIARCSADIVFIVALYWVLRKLVQKQNLTTL